MRQGQKVIAHLLFSFGMGGMENGVVKLVNGCDRQKYRHLIVSFSAEISFANRLEGDNWCIHVVHGRGVAGRVRALLPVLRRERVEVVHARGWATMFEGALLGVLLPGARTVYSFHGRSFEELSGITWKRKYLQIVLARFFDTVVTLTPAMRREIMQDFRLSERKIKVVPNGLPDRCPAREREAVRRELGIAADDLVVGSVGRLDPVKDFATVIRAFELFAAGRSNCWLLIVGEGGEYSRLKMAASRSAVRDRIVFTGFRDHVLELMRAFDVYVQASRYEGLSNTILEAMSVGLPLVCSDVGGNRDVISCGENGYLFAPGDVEALAALLDRTLGDSALRAALALRNVSKARNCYSIAAMVQGYQEVYGSLASLSFTNKTTPEPGHV